MILTRKQEEGIRVAIEKYNMRPYYKYVTISGYAGTGKSTTVKYLIEALGVDLDKVCYATFTGKAAEVLRKKGNKNAMTLHKLLYEFRPLASGGFAKRPKTSLEFSVVVVDEISMAPKSMVDLLLSFNVFCIFLGDPFQLPQIDKKEEHDILDHPDVFLDEVMRQAAESEIIQMTMKIRAQEPIKYFEGNEVLVVPRADVTTGHLTWADQIITATNKTRTQINRQMRELYGYSGPPQVGEKVICLKNYWDDFDLDENMTLVNGLTATIKSIDETVKKPPKLKDLPKEIFYYKLGLETDGGDVFEEINADKQIFKDETFSIPWKASVKMSSKNFIRAYGDFVPREFTYGYAITCHKSQGSQWENVLVLEETFPFDKLEHARWLYTACTRPEKRLVLAR